MNSLRLCGEGKEDGGKVVEVEVQWMNL